MRTLFKSIYAAVALLLIASCASVPQQSLENLAVGVDGSTCVGTVMTPPAGLVEADDTGLLQTAQGGSGQGKLCTGKVFIAEQPVTVYRVWDSSRPYTVYGSWWSLSEPQGPRDNYRKEEDICPEWSALDRVSACTIKVGTRIAIGPGQSVNCNNNLSYPPSAANQVYIPNDSRNNQVFVENCTAAAEWPQSESVAAQK